MTSNLCYFLLDIWHTLIICVNRAVHEDLNDSSATCLKDVRNFVNLPDVVKIQCENTVKSTLLFTVL